MATLLSVAAERRSVIMATMRASPTAGATIDVKGLVSDFVNVGNDVSSRAVRQNTVAWIWHVLQIAVLVIGITATTVAGISAVGDLLSKPIIGVIAITAALFTAFGAAFPFSEIAHQHWRVADDFELLSVRVQNTTRELRSDPPIDAAGMREWGERLEGLCREEHEIRGRAEQVTLLLNTGKIFSPATQRRRRRAKLRGTVPRSDK